MTCAHCGTNLIPGAAQCMVCFAPANGRAVALPPAQGIAGQIPSPVLPPRSSAPRKAKPTGWNAAGFGGGFFTMLLLTMRWASVYHNSQVRNVRTQQPWIPPPPMARSYEQGSPGSQSTVVPFRSQPSVPSAMIGRREMQGMPKLPVTPRGPGAPPPMMPDMAARQQQMQERMAADQQRLHDQMQASRQRMDGQMEALRQRMDQQMEEMRARSRAATPGPMGGQPFGGPMNPGGFRGFSGGGP